MLYLVTLLNFITTETHLGETSVFLRSLFRGIFRHFLLYRHRSHLGEVGVYLFAMPEHMTVGEE